MAAQLIRDWTGFQQFPVETQNKLQELLGKLKQENVGTLTILVMGKGGVGKSSTVNSVIGERVVAVSAFQSEGSRPVMVSRSRAGFTLNIIDTPGLVEGGYVNDQALDIIKRFLLNKMIDVLLYVDRLDSYRVDNLDRQIIKAITDSFGKGIWDRAAVVLTHAQMSPPDGLSYEEFVAKRSEALLKVVRLGARLKKQDSLASSTPVVFVENSGRCNKNESDEKVLPNGIVWIPNLLKIIIDVVSNGGNGIVVDKKLIEGPNPNDRGKLWIPVILAFQVLNEFTHGKAEKVSKSEFKEVLSDILLGMAAGLKRDPIVILRIDGQHLLEYITSSSYETETVSIYSEIESPNGTLRDHIVKALQKLGVDQGLPPTSDSWVMNNIVEPALGACVDHSQQAICQETFLVEFRKVVENIVERLKEQPVIVAHTENTYDGSAIKSLLANKFETEKVLNSALGTIPRDKHGRIPKEYLRVALDSLAPSAGLPPYGAVDEMDKVMNDSLKMVDADDGKLVKEEEFKKLLLEILGSVMLQLEGNPVSISTDSVVHEPLADPSSFLHSSTS